HVPMTAGAAATPVVGEALGELAAAAYDPSRPLQRPSAMGPEGVTPVSLGLAGYAKVLGSAVFVSERDPAEAFTNSGYMFLPDDLQSGVTYAVDRAAKQVRVTRGPVSRAAKFYADQGCIIQALDRDGIHFTPVAVKS